MLGLALEDVALYHQPDSGVPGKQIPTPKADGRAIVSSERNPTACASWIGDVQALTSGESVPTALSL